MTLVFVVLTVFAVLMGSEIWWRRRLQANEFSRKFVHISVGSFVAFWPFFLSWTQIELLSIAFLLVVVVSKYFGVFRAIHSVQRPTWGELFFAVAVGAVALMTNHKAIYAVALLQMSLADGLAAIIGVRYGRRNQYHILGAVKSVAGTLTFFVVSLLLLIGYAQYSGAHLSLLYIVGLAAATSAIENLGAYGLDNLLVPLLIATALAH